MKQKTLSKSLALLITLTLCLSLLPIPAQALELIPNNPAGSEISIEIGQYMEYNRGTVTENYGEILLNNSTVTDNFSRININDGTIANNSGTVEENRNTVINNNLAGIIELNKGDVGIDCYNPDFNTEEMLAARKTGNFGTIEINNGTIYTNQEDGLIGAYLLDEDGNQVLDDDGNRVLDQNSGNNGTIDTNRGSLFINHAQINVNRGLIGAYLLDKDGNTVLDSYGNPVIDPNSGNFGKVDNNLQGIILNHGYVESNGGFVYNYGGTTDDGGIEYFSVEIINDTSITNTDHTYENVSSMYVKDGFHSFGGKMWLAKTRAGLATGTVLLTPNKGYEIIDIAVPESGTLESAVKNDDGTWTLTFQSGENTIYEVPTATEILAPNQNGYGMNNGLNPSDSNNQTQPQPEKTSGWPISLEDYFLITLTDHTTGDVQTMACSFASAAPAPAGNAVTTTYDSFTAEKITAVKTAPKDSVVEIDLRETGWTALKRDIFEAAAARGDVTIIIYYSHWGRDYTLTIPAGTALTAEMAEAQFLEVSQLAGLLGLTAV